ncbi:pleiotropic drug resistance abc transporter [Salix suchowensis]|nr:pleiotropic drug resistance abc transporter [Salix suchowensis]
MLNISHTSKTLVGDEFVRGVSGGERKRVSIAEMMATRARVHVGTIPPVVSTLPPPWICEELRVMTDILGQTTFVTLYQAGEGIYELFDKVLVLDEGRQVFYGPAEARAYFENLGYKPLPRQSTADYLTGCTDRNERQFAPGRSANDVPSSPEALEHTTCFEVRSGNEASREKYKVRWRPRSTTRKLSARPFSLTRRRRFKKSPYTWLLVTSSRSDIRQFHNECKTSSNYTRVFLSTLLALVMVAPTSTNLCLRMARSPVADQLQHVSPSCCTGGELVLRCSLLRCPRIPLQRCGVLMCNLDRNGGAFWTFHLINYLAFLAVQVYSARSDCSAPVSTRLSDSPLSSFPTCVYIITLSLFGLRIYSIVRWLSMRLHDSVDSMKRGYSGS